MKRVFLLLLSLILIHATYAQKKFDGIWEGKIEAGGGIKMRIVFHVNKQSDGSYKGFMDSPDQGVKGIPCDKVTTANDSITIEIKTVSFKGQLVTDKNINGIFRQSGYVLALNLEKVETVSAVKRPQTPAPPFTYQSEDVMYTNADSSVRFGATFTYPNGEGPFVTAVLITGSGPQDRDETMLGHKPFAVIADYLTKNGFAVLRVDDRGMGKTSITKKEATSADFADDVVAGIHYLLQRKEVNKTKIGVIGHSEGGLIAPMVYTKWPQLGFIISLAGSGVSGAEILLRQQTDPLFGNVSKPAFDAYFELTKMKLQAIHDGLNQPDAVVLERIKTGFITWKAKQPDSLLVALNIKAATADMYAKSVTPELTPWWHYFIATEPASFLTKVKCPVLVLNGSKDTQVYPDQNVPAIQSALEKAGNKNVTVRVMPGLNHLFQHCVTCTYAEYATLEETFSPEVLGIISTWLDQTVKK